ncbi:homoserine kinase [Ruminococcaceae bacterium OttesenSCG-928-L11]|nr:homoserine kinase [Ruminococcaceae bacterium OttesenSCG-928-L11]
MADNGTGTDMVKVRIPATSANIGSGFDALGVAVALYNYVYMRESDRLAIRSHDGADIPLDKENLVWKTAKHLYDVCGKPLKGLELEQLSNIPFARGLGSSSACIIGGLLGANEMLGKPLTQDALIDMAAVLEGHPDNTTPALTGGLVTAVLDNGKVHYVKQEIHNDLRFAVIIPDFELKTSLARSVLPQEIPHTDARFNLARSALMAVSLYSGKYENLRIGADDRLHQPYRLELIPGGGQVMELCLKNGAYAAYVSGAGSSLMAIVDDAVLDFEQKTRDSLDDMGLQGWRLHILSIDNKGAILMRG